MALSPSKALSGMDLHDSRITDYRQLRTGMSFAVYDYTPGRQSEVDAKSLVMVGVFIADNDYEGGARIIDAEIRRAGSNKVEKKTLLLGLDLGFFDKAHRFLVSLDTRPF